MGLTAPKSRAKRLPHRLHSGAGNVDPSIGNYVLGEIVTPAEVFFTTVYLNWMGPGNCYGMSATSLRFFKGEDQVLSFAPNAGITAELQNDYSQDPNAPILRNIEKFSGYELGNPIMYRYLSLMYTPRQVPACKG